MRKISEKLQKKVYYEGFMWYTVNVMDKDLKVREEVNNFIACTDELVSASYILADIKIAHVLKSIAVSDVLVALFSNCLDGFDYTKAKKAYYVASPYLSKDKEQFVMPESLKDLIAFVFNVLMDLDSK